MPSKYRNIKVEVDGYKFDSKAEAMHYQYVLKPLLSSGVIHNLEVHPRFDCVINGKKVCSYIADFSYINKEELGREGQVGCKIVEDVKGVKTAVYRLKKKLVEALHPGIKIQEISVLRSHRKGLS